MFYNTKYVLKLIVGFITFVFCLSWIIIHTLNFAITDFNSSNPIFKEPNHVFQSTTAELIYVINKHRNNSSYIVYSHNFELNAFIEAKCNIINYRTIFSILSNKGIFDDVPADKKINRELILDSSSTKNLFISPFRDIVGKIDTPSGICVDKSIEGDTTSISIKDGSSLDESIHVCYNNKNFTISKISRFKNNKLINESSFRNWVF